MIKSKLLVTDPIPLPLHSGKLEFLALKWIINDKFRTIYVYYGEHFTVYSDGNALTYVMM